MATGVRMTCRFAGRDNFIPQEVEGFDKGRGIISHPIALGVERRKFKIDDRPAFFPKGTFRVHDVHNLISVLGKNLAGQCQNDKRNKNGKTMEIW